MLAKGYLQSTLPAPVVPGNLPSHAQWLSGEGAGSWFVIHLVGAGFYEVARFDPEGRLECKGVFKVRGASFFDIERPFQVTYLSHCQQVTLSQEGSVVVLDRI